MDGKGEGNDSIPSCCRSDLKLQDGLINYIGSALKKKTKKKNPQDTIQVTSALKLIFLFLPNGRSLFTNMKLQPHLV